MAVQLLVSRWRSISRGPGQEAVLIVQRVSLLLVCLGALLFVNGSAGSLILEWSFLSMGLRGCTVLFPLLAAMFLPRYVTPKAGCAAALAGPLAALFWHIICPGSIDPLYPGLFASFITLLIVSIFTRRRNTPLSAAHEVACAATRT